MPLTLFLRAEQRREVQLNWERVSDELQLQMSETRYIKSASPPQTVTFRRISTETLHLPPANAHVKLTVSNKERGQ